MKGILILSIVLFLLALSCDIIYLNTHIFFFKVVYWICLSLALSGNVYYSIKNIIKKSKEEDEPTEQIE